MKFLLKWIGKILLFLLIFVASYFLVAWACAFIPANQDAKRLSKGNQIFLRTNGVHLDLVFPIRNSLHDWTSKIQLEDFEQTNQIPEWVSLGWGDKGFFMKTPTWGDLTPSIAIKALFLPSETAMHVSLHSKAPVVGDNTREVFLSDEQYSELVRFAENSFHTSKKREFMVIDYKDTYLNVNDRFYEAKGSYYFVQTCNNWANEGLKKIGLKTAVWAPFDWSILRYFPK
ncbi:MAG: hypothetical protein ACI85I_000195 [Arenicella sp.]|jgi:uncharacterized protein (TIGR02117 family)